MEKARADFHLHTHKSNLFSRDSTNFEFQVIDKALELGLKGQAITEHGNLSSHVKAMNYLKKIRKEREEELESVQANGGNIIDYNIARDKYLEAKDFKLCLGIEIYLVDREVIEEARRHNESTKFYHLVIVAKNLKGYRAIAKLSSQSWEDNFFHRGMERVPVYKDNFFKWLEENKENVMVTTACLGGELAVLSLNYLQAENEEQAIKYRDKITEFIMTFKNILGESFYIELQPSFSEEQIAFNRLAIQIAESFGVKILINTDAHYLSEEMKEIHSIFLKSQNAERETEQFYSSTYMMDTTEIKRYFQYVDEERINSYMDNSIEALKDIEEYDLYKPTEVPNTKIEYDPERLSILAPKVLENIEKYKYIYLFGTSQYHIDRALLQQMETGIENKRIELTEEVLERINRELGSLWEISEKLNQRLSSYYLLTKEIVDIIWLVSIVGVSRGSAGAFYICYLLDITQIDPIKFDLPDWRHISADRPELPDIDIDSETGQRANILELVKEAFGFNNVLNICTFKTEGTASAIQTMCRGMGISTEEAQYLSSLAVDGKSVKECIELFNKDKGCTFLIKELMRYEGLIENIIAIEGLCCGRSSHASGVYIYNHPYWESNAMMKTPKGLEVTQYDMADSDYQGGLKLDFLTVISLDRIRKCVDLMIEDKLIEAGKNLRETYNKYLHPSKLNLVSREMWAKFCNNEILDAFQYDSVQGKVAITKIKPESFQEAMDGNALMRLTCEGKQPIDRYVEHKNNINLWYEEMIEEGLTEKEIRTLENHLLKSYGVAPTQESAMRLSMDNNIAGFSLTYANKLRKAIAKTKAKDTIKALYEKWVKDGKGLGNREAFVKYVWKTCIEPMLGYSFSEPHLAGYTLILMQELNLFMMSPLHWNTACLCVNSGNINEDVNKATDYGAMAKAIAHMPHGFVTPPRINSSSLGFKTNMQEQKVMYGLGAISGINYDVATQIINNRPYKSLDDFIKKCVETKIVQPSKTYNLIKAGCFDEINSNRIEVMKEFVTYLVPDKNKLTTSNIPKLNSYRAIPKKYEYETTLFFLRKEIFGKENIVEMYNKTQGLYKIPNKCVRIFEENYMDRFIEAIEYDDEGSICLKSKEFNNIYKEVNKDFDSWIKGEEALRLFNLSAKNELWFKYCSGSIAKWEMDSIGYYTDLHELEEMKINKYYKLSNFNELPSEPKVLFKINQRTGREYKQMELTNIAGVVVDKNKNKKIVTLSTTYGVVDVKMSQELFAYYDKKTDEDSWFKRGTKLLVNGFRRGEVFVPRVYTDSTFRSTFFKIEQINNKVILRDKDNLKIDENYVLM